MATSTYFLVTPEIYGDMCNIVEQVCYGPYEDDFKHTSPQARQVSREIIELLRKHGMDIEW